MSFKGCWVSAKVSRGVPSDFLRDINPLKALYFIILSAFLIPINKYHHIQIISFTTHCSLASSSGENSTVGTSLTGFYSIIVTCLVVTSINYANNRT